MAAFLAILKTLFEFAQVLKFFVDLYLERDKKRAEEKAVVGKEIVDAFSQADPKTRASHLNAAVQSVKQLRK